MRTHVSPKRPGLHTMTVTWPTPTETNQAVPVALPAAKPANPQVTWNLAAGDKATWSMTKLASVLMPCVILGGKNTVAAVRVLNAEIKKNGVSVATYSGNVTASLYWTLQIWLYNAAIGDVFTVYLWCSVAASLDWRYDGHQLQETRVEVSLANEFLADISYTVNTNQPTLTKGPHPSASTSRSNNGKMDSNSAANTWTNAKAGQTFVGYVAQVGWGLYQAYLGDITLADTWVYAEHATNCPSYQQNCFFGTYQWRNWGRLTL